MIRPVVWLLRLTLYLLAVVVLACGLPFAALTWLSKWIGEKLSQAGDVLAPKEPLAPTGSVSTALPSHVTLINGRAYKKDSA